MVLKKLVNLLSNRVVFLFVLLVIVIIVMSLISPYFLSLNNFLTMSRFSAALALVGIGQTLVILGGGAGIDLSVGSIISLAGVLFGFIVQSGVNVWFAAVLTVIIGGVLGSVNGLTVAMLDAPPLIATLGTNYAYGALALVLTGGVPISGFPEEFGFLASGEVLGIPTQILLIIIPVFLLLFFIMRKTSFGRHIYLIGVNEEAAQISGIQVKTHRFILYSLSGLLAGLSATVLSSWFMASRPDAGTGMDMETITVAVLGGISITGGVGDLVGTLLAIIIVTMIASGLQLANINTIWQLAVLGIILLVSVALNQLFVKSQSVN
jgi:ribose/xylose/arabinose/galactoside ABC-type transport system permease subunit